jgi:hypothetical protein
MNQNLLDDLARFGCRAAIFLASISPALGSVNDDLRFEESDFMKATSYRHPDKLAAANLAADGALSPVNIAWDQSHAGKWFIEEQRYGADAVAGGIVKNDTSAIDRGLLILHWGFNQQQPDGSFACPDAFHSTSFFVEAAAHSLLLLNESAFAAQYAGEINWISPRLLKAALWMTLPGVQAQGQRSNAPYTHRRYLVAAALGETGVLAGNRALVEDSKLYALEGIALQDPSGFNPEKGGYDCSYHAVGLGYAERYYDLVAEGELKSRLYGMLQKANAWLATRVRPDGTLDPEGNTRTGSDQEKSRNDVVKTLNYGWTYRSFYRWSLISGDAAFARLGDLVFAGEAIYKHQIGK